jgi:hypothetical protein
VTGTVDFTHDALAGKSTGLSDPDELVPQDSSEAHIPLTQLQICLADASPGDSHNDLAVLRCADFRLTCELKTIIKNDSSQNTLLPVVQ